MFVFETSVQQSMKEKEEKKWKPVKDGGSEKLAVGRASAIGPVVQNPYRVRLGKTREVTKRIVRLKGPTELKP